MTHYSLKGSVPSAIVVAKNPKTSSLDEMKLYEGKYFFLENGQEFQIRIFNPLTETIGAKIKFNGETSGSLLIIRPGEDVTIDRFLDDKNKMLFETYNYDSSNKAAEKAISKNGLLSIEFYKESSYILTTDSNISWSNPSWQNQPYYINQPYTTNTTHDINGLNLTGTNTTYSANVGTVLNNTCDTSGMYNSKPLSDTNVFLNSSFSAFEDIADKLKNTDEKGKVKETGRVEKGDESKQDFKIVDKNFSSLSFHTINYELKPVSEHKNIIPSEIRNYCPECGYRMRKKSWKFCPKCGTKN